MHRKEVGLRKDWKERLLHCRKEGILQYSGLLQRKQEKDSVEHTKAEKQEWEVPLHHYMKEVVFVWPS